MKGRLKMKIAAAFKVVPDDQDIKVAGDRTLDYSKAKNTISVYDLNALEVAAQLAAEVDGSAAVAITAGPASIDEAKLKKSALARGVEELFMTADDACAGMDAKATAAELAKLVAPDRRRGPGRVRRRFRRQLRSAGRRAAGLQAGLARGERRHEDHLQGRRARG